MMRYRRWSAGSMMVALLLAVSLACGAQLPSAPVISVPPSAPVGTAMPRAELGTVIDEYLAHGSVSFQNIRAVLVSERGELVAERYYHSDASEYVEIQSATKSVISTLVGIALTKGDLKSPDQTLGELLPQHRSAMSQSSARTTIRQLLTMTAGWTTEYNPQPAKPQLVRRVLRQGPDGDPGTFAYTDVGPHLLSAVLVQATGMSTLAYARRELFDPLGIKSQPAFEGPITDADKPEVVNKNSFRWLRDPDGVHSGPFGLALTARDMLKIGELWLTGGTWHGRRILDADYITQASTNQVPELQGKIRGYGHLWWVTPLATHYAYSASEGTGS
jgi:CubicO group peptidase (beta-lactamase class C family)